MITLDAKSHYQMSEVEKKSIVEEMDKEYLNSLNVTQDIRRRWWLVERYIEGVQWSSAGEAGWSFLSAAGSGVLNNNAMDVNVDENVVIDNIMLRIHMTNMARLQRYKPQIEIAPNQKTSENNIAVRKGRIALYDLLYKNNFTRLQASHARHLNVMGLSFLKVVYDPSAGKQVNWPILDETTGKAAVDATGRPIYKKKPEGEVKLYAVNPKNLLFPANCTCIEDADWIQESNVRSLSYIKRKYGMMVKAEPVNAFEQERNGLGKSDLQADPNQLQESAIVKERWYRACEKYPEGAIVVWASGKLLVCKSLEKWYPDLPYFQSTNVFNDESIYADCPAYHLVQHQNEINRTESNIARQVNLIGKPKLLVNRDSQVSDKAFTTDTGEIVEWTGEKGIMPSWLNAPPVAQSLYEHVDRHLSRMLMIGYANDITRPGHARSGNAIAYEQEIDENTMAPMVASVTDMFQRGLGFALELMARYYKVPRMVKMLDSNAWTIENEFKGDDLFGNFDVRVDMLAGLPANKLAKQQFVMQLFSKGLLDKPLAQKYLELGDAEAALREQAMEAEIVEKTIKTMETGATVPPHEWDEHPLMIAALTSWLKDNQEADADLIQKFEDKLKWHKEYMSVMAHPANAADGGPPEAGPGAAGVPRETGSGNGLEEGAMPEELGGAPSFQDGGAGQPEPEQVLQSGAPGE